MLMSGLTAPALVQNGAMLDSRLFGYWSDGDLYQGSPEASDIAFRPDGTGWTYWSNWGGAFTIWRFAWDTTADLRLVLRVNRHVSGTVRVGNSGPIHDVDGEWSRNDVISVGYETSQQPDAHGRISNVVTFDRHISLSVIRDRFAYIRPVTSADLDQAQAQAS
jgi:hypothetical protein